MCKVPVIQALGNVLCVLYIHTCIYTVHVYVCRFLPTDNETGLTV